MRMTVQLTGLQQLRAQLAGVSERRLAAIAATGLTRTARSELGRFARWTNWTR